jgi:hypothetical protein
MARASVRERLDRDLEAGMKTWAHLYARGLASPLVCATLFRRWGLCSCGRCETDKAGGEP